MLLHSLPYDIIIEISKFLEIEYIPEKRINPYSINNIIEIEFLDKQRYIKDKMIRSYPMHNLYATCKSFFWLEQLEYLCVEYHKFHYEIIARNIHGKFSGMAYQGIDCLIGYYGSEKPVNGYDYCWWSRIQEPVEYSEYPDHHCSCDYCWWSGKHDTFENIGYIDYITGDNDSYRNYCNRLDGGCNYPCSICDQLDDIQKEVFEKDKNVADFFKNRFNYSNQMVIVRERKLQLNFKFNFIK